MLDGLEACVNRVQIVSDAGRGLAPKELVEKDRPILDAAIASGCTHLLTGDTRHFGQWMGKSVAGVKIVSQRMMTEEMRGRGIVE